MKRKRTILIAIGLMLGLAGIGVYYGSGWSKLNCWTEEIDINSGQTRYCRYWFWCITSERLSPTWMSDLLGVPDDPAQQDWRLVIKASPGRHHSPHYAYHGATARLHTAETIFKMYDIPEERKTQLAQDIRESWQLTGSYFESRQCVTTFWEEEVLAGKYPEIKN